MIDQNDPVYRAAFAPFQALIDVNAEAMEQINREAEERAAAREAEQREQWKELAVQQSERKAAKVETETADKADEKPGNVWSRPRRSELEYGPRVGFLDEDDPPPPTPTRAPLAPPPLSGERSGGRHARPTDDDDDFGGGSWLRG